MFVCAEPLPTLTRHVLSPMNLRVRQMEMAQPVSAEHPTLMVLRRGHVVVQPRHGASVRTYSAGWATLDPLEADYAQERWSTREESHYQAVALPVQACSELLQREVPWAETGRRPFRFSDAKVSWWLDEMVAHCAAGEPHGGLYTESVGLALLSYLTTRTAQLASPERVPAGLSEPAVRKIREHVDGHLASELSLSELSALSGYSAGHLNRVFKEAVGMPLHRFVIERRLEHARRMLAADHASLAEVALACGFANQAHFSTAFKRYVGCTPRVFRASKPG